MNRKRFSVAFLLLALLCGIAGTPPTTNHQPPVTNNAEGLVERYAAAVIQRDMQQRFGKSDTPFCIEAGDIAFCIAPDTPRERSKEIRERLDRFYRQAGRQPQYNRGDRWITTASGSTGTLGNPITLTFSFVPDGVSIPASGNGDAVAPSNLFATLNPRFGGNPENWKAQFRACFARWSQVSGVRYVEVSDDGAAFPGSTGRNTAPIRGDVRISMKPIDGLNGILAYNYYPDTGDMVLDSGDANSFDNTPNNYRFLRNTVMHEHGHGGGLGHVTPTNGTKLMEAFLNTGFDGPQDDDMRGMQRNYGDPEENDDTLATAKLIGPLTVTTAYSNLSTNASGDEDWYRLSFQPGQIVSLSVAPVGGAYTIGNQGGPAPVAIDTRIINNLNLEVYAANGTTLIASANTQPAGQTETTTNLDLTPLAAGGWCYLRIRNATGAVDNVQRYTLTVNVPGIYVDKNNAGSENGTSTNPYRTVQAALNAASATQKTVIYVRPNSYSDRPMFTKPVRFLNWNNSGDVLVGTP
jgi:hypothetical protein